MEETACIQFTLDPIKYVTPSDTYVTDKIGRCHQNNYSLRRESGDESSVLDGELMSELHPLDILKILTSCKEQGTCRQKLMRRAVHKCKQAAEKLGYDVVASWA